MRGGGLGSAAPTPKAATVVSMGTMRIGDIIMLQLCFHISPTGKITILGLAGPCILSAVHAASNSAAHATKRRREETTDDYTEQAFSQIEREPEAYRP